MALLLQDAALVAAPGKVVVDLAASLGPALTGKLVMDATNVTGAPGTSPGFDALKRAGGDILNQLHGLGEYRRCGLRRSC
ncbi:MAG TPA: hypothetical protein PLL57_02485 [Flavobacteriales bacterium]|nr:hypothetical protein [Flavobacteriales bacterium]